MAQGPEIEFFDQPPDQAASEEFFDYNPVQLAEADVAEEFSSYDPTVLEKKSNLIKLTGPDTPEIAERRKQIADYVAAPEKTPEEIANMSFMEQMEYSKQLEKHFDYRMSKGLTKGIASGATLSASEWVEGANPEEDDLLFGFGEFLGATLPIAKLYNYLGKPLVKLAARSPYIQRGLKALAGMTGMGLTGAAYESGKHTIKHGEVPSAQQAIQWGGQWAALDGALRYAGLYYSFQSKLNSVLRNADNLTGQETVNKIVSQLAKDKINPITHPEQYAARAEQLLDEQLPKAAREAETKVEPAVKEFIDEVKGEAEQVKPAEELKAVEEAGKPIEEAKPAEPVEAFETEKGSLYRMEKGNKTTRNKAERPEHGPTEKGEQPTSEKTYFVSEEDAKKLGEIQAMGPKRKITELPDGRIGVQYTTGKQAGAVEGRTVVTPSATPAEGMIPVEIWEGGDRVHFGNKITKLNPVKKKPEIPELITVKVGEKPVSPVKKNTVKPAEKPLTKKEQERLDVRDRKLEKHREQKAAKEEAAKLKNQERKAAEAEKRAAHAEKVKAEKQSFKDKQQAKQEARKKADKERQQKKKEAVEKRKAEKEASAEAEKNKPPEPVHVDIPPGDLGKSSKEILAKHVVTGKQPWHLKVPGVKQLADLAETQLYNRFAPLKALGEGEASIMSKPRQLAEQVKGFASRAQAGLRLAQYSAATGEAVGPAFEQIFLPKRIKQLTGSRKLDRGEFDLYLASKSSLERQQLGHKNPLPTKAAESFIRENKAKYEPLAQDVYNFGRNQIKNLVSEGLVSEAGAEKMLELYKSHVPLFRVLPEELNLRQTVTKGLTGEAGADLPVTPGASSLKTKNPLHKAKGSDLRIKSPTESIVKNSYAFENAILKNRALKATGRGLEKQGYEVKQISGHKLTPEEIAEQLGLTVEELEELTGDIETVGEAVSFLNPEQPRGKIRWYENGNLYEVRAPKDILQAVEGLTPEQSNFVMRGITAVKNSFSLGVVLQPGTLMRLGLMDMVVSSLQSKFPKYNSLLELPTRAIYEYPRMLFNIMGKTKLYQEYMHSGAAQVSLQGLDRQMLESMTDTFTNAASRSSLLKQTMEQFTSLPKKILNGLRKTSETLGDIPRMLEFERSMAAAIKRGATKQEAMVEAAFDAFEVSVPYGRKGASSSLRTMYNIFPFINTIVNSNVSLAKTLSPSNPMFRSAVASATAYLTIPTVGLYLKNRNDPRYQALPQEDKDRNIYAYSTDDPNEEPIKMRKMWQYGYLFQTLPEHIVEYIIQRDPAAFKGLLKSFEYEFSPLTMLSFSSAINDGKVEPMKLFEGGKVPFIPERQKRIDAELQHTSNTTETAKLLGKYTNISPIYIDHIIGMTGGGLGTNVVRLADEFFYMTGIKEDRRPAKQAADSIFFGTWYGRGPSKRNEYINQFYKFVDKNETRKNTAKALRHDGRDEEADKLMENYYNTGTMRKALGKYYKEIERIREEHPDDLNGVEKRAELNRIYIEMTDLAKEFVEEINSETSDKK